MNEKRDQRGFVRAADALPDLLPGFESMAPAVCRHIEQDKAVTPQRRHHFNRLQQIDALARIAEDKNPDMGFMTRMLTSSGRST